MTPPPPDSAVTKPPNQDWQHCAACGLWWPVDRAFAALEIPVDTECPGCGQPAPSVPALRADPPQDAPPHSETPSTGFDQPVRPASGAPDRVVLVTGGAGGIGQACGRWFAQRGATVVLADLDAAAGARAAADCKARTGSGAVVGVQLDVTDETQVGAVLATVERDYGALHVLVNAAGVVGAGSVSSMAASDWRRVLDINLTGTFLACRAAIPLLRRSAGKIVNLSSVNARTGGNELSGAAYAAAKAGIEALTRHLAKSLAPGVQVNAVAPGPVDTPMVSRLAPTDLAALVATIPAGRLARAEEVAALVGFLCSPDADYVTGVTVAQNGGQWLG